MTPNQTDELIAEVRRLRHTIASAAVALAGDQTGSASKSAAVAFLNRARNAGMNADG